VYLYDGGTSTTLSLPVKQCISVTVGQVQPYLYLSSSVSLWWDKYNLISICQAVYLYGSGTSTTLSLSVKQCISMTVGQVQPYIYLSNSVSLTVGQVQPYLYLSSCVSLWQWDKYSLISTCQAVYLYDSGTSITLSLPVKQCISEDGTGATSFVPVKQCYLHEGGQVKPHLYL
jgi:hypothetical protein